MRVWAFERAGIKLVVSGLDWSSLSQQIQSSDFFPSWLIFFSAYMIWNFPLHGTQRPRLLFTFLGLFHNLDLRANNSLNHIYTVTDAGFRARLFKKNLLQNIEPTYLVDDWRSLGAGVHFRPQVLWGYCNCMPPCLNEWRPQRCYFIVTGRSGCSSLCKTLCNWFINIYCNRTHKQDRILLFLVLTLPVCFLCLK